MRREARAAQACDPDARRRFLGLQHVAAPAGPHALELRRRLGHGERAALGEVAVDRLARAGATSSTVSWAARCSAATAASPAAARSREPVEMSPSTQPPSRPEAPNPATSRSTTTTSSEGSARRSS
jgi:hypothetical protein